MWTCALWPIGTLLATSENSISRQVANVEQSHCWTLDCPPRPTKTWKLRTLKLGVDLPLLTEGRRLLHAFVPNLPSVHRLGKGGSEGTAAGGSSAFAVLTRFAAGCSLLAALPCPLVLKEVARGTRPTQYPDRLPNRSGRRRCRRPLGLRPILGDGRPTAFPICPNRGRCSTFATVPAPLSLLRGGFNATLHLRPLARLLLGPRPDAQPDPSRPQVRLQLDKRSSARHLRRLVRSSGLRDRT